MVRRHSPFITNLLAAVLTAAFAGGVLAAPKKEKEPPPKKVTATAPVKRDQEGRARPISATHAILIEAENGSVLFENNAEQLIYPASLAKLMTAEYVLHLHQAGQAQADRRIPGQRERLAQGRRALAHLDHVRRDP